MEYKNQKFIGFCDFGNEINIEGAEVLATEALGFILVGLKGNWKWPIGYFFITSTDMFCVIKETERQICILTKNFTQN